MPEVPLLISYQDTDVHTGTIYKAAGWREDGSQRLAYVTVAACGWEQGVFIVGMPTDRLQQPHQRLDGKFNL